MSTYDEIWKSLNIDLETHCNLLDVLGQVYTDIYLRQDKRPEAMEYFDFVIGEVHGLRIKELLEHKAKGGFIAGTFCLFVPDELVLAAGGLPIGLCGGADLTISRAEEFLPRNICPLIKSSVGFKLARICPYFESSDFLIGETTCDGKKKAWEVLNNFIPTQVMHVPHMKNEAGQSIYRLEIERLMEKLEEAGRTKISFENVKEAIAVMNNKRRALAGLYETRKHQPSPISGKDALLISQVAFYDDIPRFTAAVNKLKAELNNRIEKGISPFAEDAPRVMLSGCPSVVPNWKLHHIIETSGASVVVEEACTGTRYFETLVDESSADLNGQLDALARRYLSINCSCFTPNHERTEQIIHYAREYHVDGVVYNTLQFCHTYNVEYTKVEQALKEASIPVLKIETDYAAEDAGQIQTRIEAFLERIKS
ncbi:MAG: double-cubane-cluster-containing anaerobic reductase [bacterium]